MNSSILLPSSSLYHGDDADQIGQVGALLKGTGRYKVLWDDDRIGEGFGILTGVSKDSIRELINYPTLSKKNRMEGRQLILKAKDCIKETKIFLAAWTNYTKNGGFPSGKNEQDALQYCIQEVASEHKPSFEKDDLQDDDDEEDEPPVSQSRAKTQPLKDTREKDSDNDEAEDDGDEDEDEEVQFISKKSYSPPATLTFMLLGPYGVGLFGFELSAVFSIDTEGIEKNAKTGMYSTKSMKEEKKVVADHER